MRDVRRGESADPAAGDAQPAPGKRSLTARLSPQDVAAVAVDRKDAGRAVDPGVRAEVEAHVGAGLGAVRVHDDPLAQSATAAMGARAFAYRSDVFLGPGERATDRRLMAHELTHVVQQGAAGTAHPQRQLAIGAASSPAEHEADQVADRVTAGRPPSLLVDDDAAIATGQMAKTSFLTQLRAEVTAAANAELGPIWWSMGCPTIDRAFARWSPRPAAEVEAFLRRYAPGTASCATAAAMVPVVVARVRDGIRAWQPGGELPADLAGLDPDGAVAPHLGATAAAMGPSAPIDPGTAARMGAAYGEDLGGVRVHVGPEAAAFAAEHGAIAVTAGDDIAFASGAYRPGSLEGDALLAHELAHVVQQRGAPATGIAQRKHSAEHETDADRAAEAALAKTHGRATGRDRTGPALRSEFSLQRCSGGSTPPAVDPFVAQLRTKLQAHDVQGAFNDIIALNGSRASDAAVRTGITGFVPQGLLTNAQAFRALLVLSLGADGRATGTGWPVEVRNFADGVDAGVYSVTLSQVPATRDSIRAFCMTQAGLLAESGAGLIGEYRARFNALWETPPHSTVSDAFDETPGQGGTAAAPGTPNAAQGSRGPRNRRARSVFTALLAADARFRTAYDTDTPAGFRDGVDTYAGPSGTNRIASPRLERVRAALSGAAIAPAPNVTAASYVALLATVQPLVNLLDAADHDAIQLDAMRWLTLYEQKLAGSSPDVVADLRSVVENSAPAAPAARSTLSTPPPPTAPPAPGGSTPTPTPTTGPRAPTPAEQAWLRTIHIAPPPGPIDVEDREHALHFNVSAPTNNPSLPFEREVTLTPAAQALHGSDTSLEPWPIGQAAMHYDPTITPETPAVPPNTSFTARLAIPSYASFFPAQTTAPVVVRDKRRDAFIRDIRPGLNLNRNRWVNPTTPAVAYYGGQLPISIYPRLDSGTNQLRSVFVRGVLRNAGGGAAVASGTFAATEFRFGEEYTRIDDMMLVQPGPPNPGAAPTYDSYELALEYLSARTGPVFHTPPVAALRVRRTPLLAAPAAADGTQLTNDRIWLNTAPPVAAPSGDARTTVREFLKFPPSTLNAQQQQNCRRVETAIAAGVVPLEPMIIRSDSAHVIDNGGSPIGDPTHMVAWALGTLAPGDVNVTTPYWTGWRAWRGPAIYLARWLDPAGAGAPTSQRSIDELGRFAAHESIHSVDDPPTNWNTAAGPTDWDQYRQEFRAYWVDGGFANLATTRDESFARGPKSPRANAIFEHIYNSYDHTRHGYDGNVGGFRELCDNYLYPDGINLIVSVTLNALKAALRNHTGTFAARHARVQTAFTACTSDDKAEIVANRAWRDDVEANFSTALAPVPGASPARSEPQRHQIKVMLRIPE